jgi:hypothetical protein
MPKDSERITPQGAYQESLEHALTMAHLLEHAVMFLPKDCELWHRSGVELTQFGGWINQKINAAAHQLESRRHHRS